jgi:lathosterol oxidase
MNLADQTGDHKMLDSELGQLLVLYFSKYKDAAFRGILILGGLYTFFWIIKPKFIEKFRVRPPGQQEAKPKGEMFYTFTTYLVYAFFSSLIVVIYKKTGYIAMYTDVSQFGWLYTIASFFIFVFYSDTTFYWSHVLMHKSSFFYKTHSRHHRFINVTPWAAYAFHTGEAFLSAGSFFFLMLLLPWHPMVLLTYVVFSIFYNGMLHSGYDLMPIKWRQNSVLKWMSTPTHHIYHHQVSNCNYGFILTFWDKIMKTERLPN